MAAGFGLLGLTPQAFWSLSPRELASALRGRLGPIGSGTHAPTRGEVEALMQQYPD